MYACTPHGMILIIHCMVAFCSSGGGGGGGRTMVVQTEFRGN